VPCVISSAFPHMATKYIWIHTQICIYIHTYIYTYNTHKFVFTYIPISICIHAYMYIYTRTHTHIYMYAYWCINISHNTEGLVYSVPRVVLFQVHPLAYKIHVKTHTHTYVHVWIYMYIWYRYIYNNIGGNDPVYSVPRVVPFQVYPLAWGYKIIGLFCKRAL